MNIQQKEQLREILIDYLLLLNQTNLPYNTAKVAQVRLLLKEVA